MSAGYPVTSRDRWVGVANLVWIAVADAALHVTGRAAACLPEPITPYSIDPAEIAAPIPGECMVQVVAPGLELAPRLHQGTLLGLGSPAVTGYPGQLFALGLTMLCAIATVLLLRWQYRGPAEPRILGLAWGCVLSLVWPRFVFGGQGLATLHVIGVPVTVAELVLPVVVVWMVGRVVGEARA